jgi:hypothetical protein|nr:hypothetical protein [uncultured Acetatifactor sp.]
MIKYILRDGVVCIPSGNDTILYDVYRRKMMLIQQVNQSTFMTMLSNENEMHTYKQLLLKSLLQKNYIIDSNDKIFSINYEMEFRI